MCQFSNITDKQNKTIVIHAQLTYMQPGSDFIPTNGQVPEIRKTATEILINKQMILKKEKIVISLNASLHR